MSDRDDEFIANLTGRQSSLYAYIRTLVPDRAQAEDILQETNVTLWQKADEYRPGTNFLAWACTVAHYKVLNLRKRLSRERHLFDDALVDTLASEMAEQCEATEERRGSLHRCMEKLPPTQRKLLEERYQTVGSVAAMAERWDRSVAVLSQQLYRLRLALAKCMETALTKEPNP